MPAPTHLLDTSVFSQPLKQKPVQAALNRWASLGDGVLSVSIISEAEIRYGLDWKAASGQLQKFESTLLPRVPVLPVDSAVARAYAAIRADLRRRGMPVGDMDILIGATARAHNLIVATLNVKDFARMDGVSVEDWSI